MVTKEAKRLYDSSRKEERVRRQRERRAMARIHALATGPSPVKKVTSADFNDGPVDPATLPEPEAVRRQRFEDAAAHRRWSEGMQKDAERTLRRSDLEAWARGKVEVILGQPGAMQEYAADAEAEYIEDPENPELGTIEHHPLYAKFMAEGAEANRLEDETGEQLHVSADEYEYLFYVS